MFQFVPIFDTDEVMEKDLKSLFLRGNYQEVLALTLDSSRADFQLLNQDHTWIIGALCFLGRKDEAESLFAATKSSAEPKATSACQFFLGVAYCRHGHYAKARKYFASNLRSFRREQNELGFFAWQGVSFFRYFCANFDGAERAALRALSLATIASFPYGRALALDIVGHSLVQQGQITAGLRRFKEAQKAAEGFKNNGLINSIEISSIVYRAQFGMEPQKILSLLQKARKLDAQNSYAQANLLLELGNQLVLRGKIENALGVLNEASRLIYGSQHRRYSHLLSLRFAEMSYRKGEFAQALHAAQILKPVLDKKYDRVNFLMLLGLEHKLLIALGMHSEANLVRMHIDELTERTNRSISKNIAKRDRANWSPEQNEDQISNFLNAPRDSQRIQNHLNGTYKEFVYEFMDLVPGSNWIIEAQDNLLILNKGEVTEYPTKLPEQLRLVLSALVTPKTKADLIKQVWGYDYHPLHHDPILYQSVARIREALGHHGYLIQATKNGYQLMQGFNFVSTLELKTLPASPPKRSPALSKVGDHAVPVANPVRSSSLNLNARQIRILSLLSNKQFLGVRECAKKFQVCSMTVKRDFSDLVNEGLVDRVGRARATLYTLPQHNPSTRLVVANRKGVQHD